MVIALGYRVQSEVAVRFRIWATEKLHEYIQKGFTLDDDRLKQGGNRDITKMRMILRALARNESTIVSDITIIKDVNDGGNYNVASKNTILTYIDVLEKFHILDILRN